MPRERWTLTLLGQELADETERASIRRWAAASIRWAALSVAIEDAARAEEARARLEQALLRLPWHTP
jgi:formate dehydrogenase maturation protein FdhE